MSSALIATLAVSGPLPSTRRCWPDDPSDFTLRMIRSFATSIDDLPPFRNAKGQIADDWVEAMLQNGTIDRRRDAFLSWVNHENKMATQENREAVLPRFAGDMHLPARVHLADQRGQVYAVPVNRVIGRYATRVLPTVGS